jgi:hypothetical protein
VQCAAAAWPTAAAATAAAAAAASLERFVKANRCYERNVERKKKVRRQMEIWK